LDAAGQRDEVRGVVDPVLRAEQQQGRALQEERDADRGDQRRDPRRVAQRPVGEPLDRHAQPADQARRQHQHDQEQQGHRDRQVLRAAEPLDHEETDVRPDHVQVAVREVEQLQDPVHHREAQRHQRIERARGESVHQFLEEEAHPARILPFKALTRSAAGRRQWIQAPARGGTAALGSADHELGISLYLPAESILNRKNLPPFRSPCESKEIGWPRIEAGSFVALIAASTLLRLGVCPDLQTDAIASSITCIAAYTGGPNVPNCPYFCSAALAITASAGIAVMSGPNEDTYEPGMVNVPGENSPSVPKITAVLCCWARFLPNC